MQANMRETQSLSDLGETSKIVINPWKKLTIDNKKLYIYAPIRWHYRRNVTLVFGFLQNF